MLFCIVESDNKNYTHHIHVTHPQPLSDHFFQDIRDHFILQCVVDQFRSNRYGKNRMV